MGVRQVENATPTLRRPPEDRAVDAGGAQTLERRLLRFREEDRHGNRLRIAAGLPRPLSEQADLLRRVPAAPGERHPTVRELHDTIESCRAVAAHQDRWVRLLNGLRERPDPVEIHELAMELRFLLSPNLLHREDALPEQSPSSLEVGAVILHLLGVPATAAAEEEPPAGETVERGHFFRRDDGIALDDEADSRAEAQA